jgi:hypothetical protein
MRPEYDLYGVVDRGEEAKGFWQRIGAGWKNKDGSVNLRFDFFPTDAKTTIQIRKHVPKTDEPEGGL